MKEQLVLFETAKLLKKYGFDWKCDYFKDKKDKKPFLKIGITNSKLEKEIKNWKYKCIPPNNIAIPTQSLVQKWLREKYDIHIEIYPCTQLSNRKILSWDFKIYNISNNELRTLIIARETNNNNYEQALENALQEALKLILNNKN